MFEASILLMQVFLVALVQCSTSEQSGYRAGGTGTGSGIKAKKIQIVYIKVPLSKVLQSANGDKGVAYNSGGNANLRGHGLGHGLQSAIPGEENNYGSINGLAADNYKGFAANENFESGRHNYEVANYGGRGPNNFNKPSDISYGGVEGNQAADGMYGSEDNSGSGKLGAGFASNGNMGVGLALGGGGGGGGSSYPSDANLGVAYGAAVGNALPQAVNFDDSANFGQESQSQEYGPNGQLGGFGQSNSFAQNGKVGSLGPTGGQGRPFNHNLPFGVFGQNIQSGQNGFGQTGADLRPYGSDNYEKSKLRKVKPHYPNLMAAANYRPQIPVMPPLPTFDDMKGFVGPSFTSNSYPSFDSKGFGGTSFGSFGGLSGFGGIKNKLSMLLGGKFGGISGGGGGGLLGSMMGGWD